MDITLNKTAIEIIDNYMSNAAGLERVCANEFRSMVQKVFDEKGEKKLVYIKGEQPKENEFDLKFDNYFQGSSWYSYSWNWGRSGRGYKYFLKGKCERYFESNSERFILNFLSETYGNIETAVLQTDCFLELWQEFEEWFEQRRVKFMEKMGADIQKWKEGISQSKPQSHGGVANLLKVLTRTMEKQGADIQNIAKVQYAVCIQAGIYIPDDFIRDVAVTLDMKEIEQLQEESKNEID